MKRIHLSLLSILIFTFLMPSLVLAHGDISKFPPSVQILQYKMALYMNPDDLETKNKLGIAYWLANKLDEAECQFKEVLQKDPRNFNALDGIGLVYLKGGKLDSALEFFEKAGQINPSDILVHVHKAITYERMGKKELAQGEFAKARSLAGGPVQEKKIEKEIELLKKAG